MAGCSPFAVGPEHPSNFGTLVLLLHGGGGGPVSHPLCVGGGGGVVAWLMEGCGELCMAADTSFAVHHVPLVRHEACHIAQKVEGSRTAGFMHSAHTPLGNTQTLVDLHWIQQTRTLTAGEGIAHRRSH